MTSNGRLSITISTLFSGENAGKVATDEGVCLDIVNARALREMVYISSRSEEAWRRGPACPSSVSSSPRHAVSPMGFESRCAKHPVREESELPVSEATS